MKKRIVALILTVVMSLLALTSCGSFNFAEEDLSSYATFDYGKFKEALLKLEIEDGEFTTNGDTREQITNATIYNVIADKIIADTDEEEWLKSGELTAGDVLYFVYYAVDADGNVFFGDQMNESSITTSSTKANHVIKLGDYFGKDDDFLKLIAENLKEGKLEDYVYDMLTKSELEADAEEALKESNPDATADEIKNAKAEAIKVKDGDKVYISYTRTYTKTEKNEEGVETTVTVTEKASYELITINSENPLYSFFTDADSIANIGSTLEVLDTKEGDTVKRKKSFNVTIDGQEYTYSDVSLRWKVGSEGQPIASFEYTPYDEKKETAPSSLYSSTGKIDLKDKALTYYVYPVYAIDTPAFEEITVEQILFYVYGSKLTNNNFDALKDKSYKNGDDTVEDLLADIVNIFATTAEDNEYYKDGTELKTLLDAYDKAVKDGGDKPNDDQKKVINDAKEALTDAQNKELKAVIAKLAAATSGDKKLGDEIFEEYVDNTFHTLKESYDNDITQKVQKAVWELIDESVTVTGYPEELVKEYCEHLYEEYEYDFYKGDFDKDKSNYEEYGTFQNYLEKTLGVVGENKIDQAIEKKAKEYIEPIIKIYVVAKACRTDAEGALKGENGYVALDVAGGVYRVDEEYYRDTYGDAADEKIAEAVKNAKENEKDALEDAGNFIVDDAYMKDYKKEIGSAYYNQLIDQYGEINLRAAFQFNRLFYYLTSTNVEFNEEEGHSEISYTEDGQFIDFRTVKYTIVEEKADTDTEE